MEFISKIKLGNLKYDVISFQILIFVLIEIICSNKDI